MSLSSGFFNSVDHDRLYNAEDMSRLFDGLIRDGVFASIGTCMVVKANTKMTVNVGIGRAWFNHTWTLNDAIMPVTLEQSHVLWNRIDAVVIEVNSEENVRQNSIKVIQGEPSTNPVKPTLTKSVLVNQYPLAYITVPAAATELRQADIENTVGTTECPFVSGILSVISIEELIPQWKDILDRFVETNTANFNTWMSDEKAAYAAWLQSNKDDYNKLVKEQTTSYNTWFDGIKNSYSNWFASIKEAYDSNWATFQKWESTSKSEYNSWFTGVKSTYDTNWAAFQKWEKDAKKDFEDWYEDVQNQLSGDVVAKIYDTIDSIQRSAVQLVELPLGEAVEGTIEAPIVIESVVGTGTLTVKSKYLTGGIDDYAYATYNDATYDKTTHTVTFGSQDGSGVYFTLRKNIYNLESGKKYTLRVNLEASAALSDLTAGVEMGDDHVYQSTLTAGKNALTIEFTYNGSGKLTFVLYSKGTNAAKTVKFDDEQGYVFRLIDWNGLETVSGSTVEITANTKFPLYSLTSFDGDTMLYVSSKVTDVTAYCATEHNAKALLDADKHAMEETVALIGSTDKNLKQTLAAPMMITGATVNLLNPTLSTLSTTTQNGVTCTNNGNGTYTLNGTSTGEITFTLYNISNITNFIGKTVRCTHLNNGFGISAYLSYKFVDSNNQIIYETSYYKDINNKFTITADVTALCVEFKADFPGIDLSNVTIKPMLTTDLNATYDDFVPYSGYDIKTCGKNLINLTLATTTQSGVAITNNGDGTYTLNGTATQNVDFIIGYANLINGLTYNMLPARAQANTGIYNYLMNGENGQRNGSFVYQGKSNVDRAIHLCVYAGFTCDSIIVKQMLTTDLDATYDDFEPYQSSGTVHIDSTTEFPLLGLNTLGGETNIITPGNVNVYYAGNEQGKYILETIYKAANSGGTYYGPQAPTGTIKAGSVWFDSGRSVIKVYNGTSWVIPQARDMYGADVIRSTTKPGRERDTLWIDSANSNSLKYVPAGGGEAIDLAAGGVSVGATAPTNTKLLWIDTSSGGVSKYYNGSAWVATASVWG